MPKEPKKPTLPLDHIRLIICKNERLRAAELIMMNGYASIMDDALEIIDREDGK